MVSAVQNENSYQIGSVSFSGQSPEFQGILADAHKNKQRPLCLCTSPRPAMYVALIGEEFFLKRMPGTGHLHDPTCSTFDPPPELSGLGAVKDKAIKTDEAGETELKLDFALSVRDRRAAPPEPGDAKATSAVASPSKLSLLGTLHYLWDAADLTKWRPEWKRRNWYRCSQELRAVAERSHAKGHSLSSVLFVPPMYSQEARDQLVADRTRFMQPFQVAKGRPTQLGMVIAEFKSIEPSQYGRKMTLKHMPGFAFFMDDALGKSFDRLMTDNVQIVEATPGAHLIVMATYSLRGRYAEIHEITTMPVDCHWVPFDGDRELQLITALADRRFAKCMKYNLHPDAPVANALLLDTGQPVALYAPPSDLSDEDSETLLSIAEAGVYDLWIWPPNEAEMPELPSAAHPDPQGTPRAQR